MFPELHDRFVKRQTQKMIGAKSEWGQNSPLSQHFGIVRAHLGSNQGQLSKILKGPSSHPHRQSGCFDRRLYGCLLQHKSQILQEKWELTPLHSPTHHCSHILFSLARGSFREREIRPSLSLKTHGAGGGVCGQMARTKHSPHSWAPTPSLPLPQLCPLQINV